MIDPKISNKVAIVTGANSGIGASIARALASQGAKVIIHYLKDISFPTEESSFVHTSEGEKSAQKVAKSIADLPGEAEIIDRKSTRLNSSHVAISYAVFC